MIALVQTTILLDLNRGLFGFKKLPKPLSSSKIMNHELKIIFNKAMLHVVYAEYYS